MMELMACLCVFSMDGYDATLDILKAHQVKYDYASSRVCVRACVGMCKFCVWRGGEGGGGIEGLLAQSHIMLYHLISDDAH